MAYDDWVDWRLAHGSECHVCPLNGQRKVGCIGDPDAGPIAILEAPGAEEEAYNAAHQKYGVPIVGRSGWALKHKLLAPVGLVEVEQKEGQWPRVKKWNCFVMNTIMCRPPDNKINSPEGKKAKVCCSNSAKSLLQYLLERNPDRVLMPLGGTALDLLTGQATIGPYRGRVLSLKPQSLTPLPKDDVIKLALKGVKPPEESKPHLKIIQLLVKQSQKTLDPAWVTAWQTKEAKRLAKIQAAETKAQEKKIKAQQKELLLTIKPYLTLLNAVLKKQQKSWSQHKSA